MRERHFMDWRQNAQQVGRADIAPGSAASPMRQPLAWPAAALVIIGMSLLLWIAFGGLLLRLIG